ncbi:MAG: mechanosensitive ion channel [Bacteroidales bacterium]|nr:mechanosensitive ion channel [Bacteroidales bacterium]
MIADYAVWLAVILLALLTYFLTKWILLGLIHRVTAKSKTKWDDALVEAKLFKRASLLVPAYIIHLMTPLVLPEYPVASGAIRICLSIFMTLVAMFTFYSFLDGFNVIYQDFSVAKSKPIKGYLQIIKILVFIIIAIIIIAHLFGKNPLGILGGLGAFSAVLLLIFRDPILGFVGGIQLSANNMLQPGDWITMEKYGADGTVIDIALTTVKVQNWDKTISTIPTYALIENSFRNWRGMEESGGRRIKRAISIDMNTVRFCTPEMLDKFRKIEYLKKYVDNKEAELQEYNRQRNIDSSILVNGRRQTNLGVFRAYLESYLRNHPQVRQDMTFLVRQLQPSDTGLPLEIYVFSKEQEWAKYEDVQSDIFDHILAVVPEFGLSVHQQPTGQDFRALAH